MQHPLWSGHELSSMVRQSRQSTMEATCWKGRKPKGMKWLILTHNQKMAVPPRSQSLTVSSG